MNVLIHSVLSLNSGNLTIKNESAIDENRKMFNDEFPRARRICESALTLGVFLCVGFDSIVANPSLSVQCRNLTWMWLINCVVLFCLCVQCHCYGLQSKRDKRTKNDYKYKPKMWINLRLKKMKHRNLVALLISKNWIECQSQSQSICDDDSFCCFYLIEFLEKLQQSRTTKKIKITVYCLLDVPRYHVSVLNFVALNHVPTLKFEL